MLPSLKKQISIITQENQSLCRKIRKNTGELKEKKKRKKCHHPEKTGMICFCNVYFSRLLYNLVYIEKICVQYREKKL